MTAELLSAVIHLTPDQPLPVWLGRAGQAWLLNRVRHFEPALADLLHSGQTRRPYTVSVPRGTPDQYWLRITSTSADLSQVLRDSILPELQLVLLAGIEIPVASVQLTDHAWAGQTDYQTLARLAFDQPNSALRLEFATPTAFHQQGLSVPLPLPSLVYGSLIQSWNLYSPVLLPIEMGPFVERYVGIAHHNVATRMVQAGLSERHVGFTGNVTFMVMPQEKNNLPPDTYRLHVQVLHLLTQFAFYTGVGVRTAVGMGQVHPV
jgi:CRISPR-associated endoribonuclease Cas6